MWLVFIWKRCLKKVHRIVLEAFVGMCPEGMEARHLDGDRQNNHVSNLVWDVYVVNVSDRRAHGTDQVGDRNPNAKLTCA
jgi:hypothetical protein